jgi:hypothetical protein
LKLQEKEKDIEAAILHFLDILKSQHKGRIYFWKQHTVGIWDSKRGTRRKSNNPYVINGVADILVCYYGVFISLEVKSKTGKLRNSQKEFRENIRKAGGVYQVVRSVDEVRRFFDSLKNPCTGESQGIREEDTPLSGVEVLKNLHDDLRRK